MAEIMVDYIIKSTRPSRFFVCNVEKHGKAWGQGYAIKLVCMHNSLVPRPSHVFQHAKNLCVMGRPGNKAICILQY